MAAHRIAACVRLFSRTTSVLAEGAGPGALPLSPAVRRLVDEHHLNAKSIPATGPKGRLLKGDILAFLDAGGKAAAPVVTKAAPAVSATPSKSKQKFEDQTITNIRRVIAQRLTESKGTIPHAYASVAVNMAGALKFRQTLAKEGSKISVNDIVIKAAASALREVPVVNSTWRDGVASVSPSVDISVAVATPTGLITPIVTRADSRTIEDVNATVQVLADKAKSGTLKPAEFQGGSFTISNLGMFGIHSFQAVINPPQTAILAVGAGRVALGADEKPTTVASFDLCYDARVISPDKAAEWLASLRKRIEAL
eukprot:m.236159 g.236159  ORF g.236159 m.236159 type:complete len:311 (+) comp20465_c0_seq1:28-960(+)